MSFAFETAPVYTPDSRQTATLQQLQQLTDAPRTATLADVQQVLTAIVEEYGAAARLEQVIQSQVGRQLRVQYVARRRSIEEVAL